MSELVEAKADPLFEIKIIKINVHTHSHVVSNEFLLIMSWNMF